MGADLATIRERLAAAQAVCAANQIFGGEVEEIYEDYVRDVAALLAEIDGRKDGK